MSQSEPGVFGNGVVVSVTARSSITIKAQVPGEISGPGVALTLEIRNGSSTPVDAGGIGVTVSYGPAATPADSSSGSPASSPSGVIAPGSTAKGTWVFSVPKASQKSLVVQVGSTSSPDVVVFRLS